MPSSTVEDYLKQLWVEQQAAGADLVPMGRLAAAMGVVPGTVTSMVKTLADSGLVSYEPRSGARLTKGGEQLALHVLRRHRLLEVFLVKVLGMDWSEVHEEAEHLEHVISDKVLERIDALLGHPSVDPHGDPIPSPKGKMVDDPLLPLAEAPLHQRLCIARVTGQESPFLQFLNRAGLMPDTLVMITDRDPLADSITLQTSTHPSLTIGTAAAHKILVRRL
jgi:DtxR family transcriptional regulator, Mn-dependent transcriptional regulator